MFVNILGIFFGEDYLHDEAAVFEGEAVGAVVNAEAAFDTFGRLEIHAATYFLAVEGFGGAAFGVAGGLNAVFGGMKAEAATGFRIAVAVEASAAVVRLPNVRFFCFCKAVIGGIERDRGLLHCQSMTFED